MNKNKIALVLSTSTDVNENPFFLTIVDSKIMWIYKIYIDQNYHAMSRLY